MIFFDSLNDTNSEEANPEFAISLSVCNFKLNPNEKKRIIPKNVFMEFMYLEIPEIIAYTKDKSLEELSKKELWCRFLAYNQKDKNNGTIQRLCDLDEGIQMAQKTMVKVTQRDREIARELAEFKYRLTIKYEREEERELAKKEIAEANKRADNAEAEIEHFKEENAKLKAELEKLKNNS